MKQGKYSQNTAKIQQKNNKQNSKKTTSKQQANNKQTIKGRPTKITNELINDMVYKIERGASIRQACIYVGISQTTFNEWYNNKPVNQNKDVYENLKMRIENAKENLSIKARECLYNEIVEKKNIKVALRYLELHDADFDNKRENKIIIQQEDNVGVIANKNELTEEDKAILDKIFKEEEQRKQQLKTENNELKERLKQYETEYSY